MRRIVIALLGSTYVRSEASAADSSTPGSPMALEYLMVNDDRSDASTTAGLYMYNHTHCRGFDDGTKRSHPPKPTHPPPPAPPPTPPISTPPSPASHHPSPPPTPSPPLPPLPPHPP